MLAWMLKERSWQDFVAIEECGEFEEDMLDFPCLGWRSCPSSRPLLHGWQLANKVLFHHHCVYRTLHFVWPADLKKQTCHESKMMEITQNSTRLSQEITKLTRLRMFWMALLMVMSLGTVAWAESPYFKLLGVPWTDPEVWKKGWFLDICCEYNE